MRGEGARIASAAASGSLAIRVPSPRMRRPEGPAPGDASVRPPLLRFSVYTSETSETSETSVTSVYSNEDGKRGDDSSPSNALHRAAASPPAFASM